jgi:hypothetical protein
MAEEAGKVNEAATPPLTDGKSPVAGAAERGSSSSPEPKETIEEMLNRLEITEEEEDAIDLTGLIENKTSMKWAVIIRVCLKTPFSHTAFYEKMRVAWAAAQEVTFRDIDEFTFVAQFKCLGDWRTAVHGGPWLFRRNAIVVEEYDGLINTETIALDSIRVWARIMGLPELVRNKAAMMASNMGEVLDVELGSNGVQYVKFVRVYLRINLSKPLLRFVTGRVDAGKAPQKFRVLYEKMPRFCAFCGVIGHVADECRDGSHDPNTYQYGDFMMVPDEDFWYQPKKEYVVRPQAVV